MTAKMALQSLAFLHVHTDRWARRRLPRHQTLLSDQRGQTQLHSIHPLPTICKIHLSIYRVIISHTLRERVLEGKYTLYSQLSFWLTSTRLISIMLSRFRMTVDECIAEYKSLGNKVFGHPRPFNKGGFPWHKFDYRVLETVIKDVTKRFGEEKEWEHHFPLEEDLCRTWVHRFINPRVNTKRYCV